MPVEPDEREHYSQKSGSGDGPSLGATSGRAAAIGTAVALVDLAGVSFLPITAGRLAALLVAYAAFGALLASVCWGLARAARRLVSPSSWIGQLLDSIPLAVVLLAFVGTEVNARWLPALAHPVSLVANAVLLVASAACGLAWCGRRRSRLLDGALGLVLVSAATALAWTARAPGEGHGAPAPEGRRPDVVMIVVDTLRADHLGFNGYRPATSPFIDALAARSLVFDNMFSTSNWTRPAVASLFTSTLPARHGVTGEAHTLSERLPLLSESFRAAGYQVGFFVASYNVDPVDGYARGVDHFHDARIWDVYEAARFGRRWFLPALVALQPNAQLDPVELVESALRWTRELSPKRPLFLYVHLHGPHRPYAPPDHLARQLNAHPVDHSLTAPPERWSGRDALTSAERRQMIAQYDAKIRWHDMAVGELLEGLRAAGRLSDTALLLTADHGEAFGEHGTWAHGSSLFEELTRVPALLWLSEDGFEPGRVASEVSLIDLAPTLLDLAGLSRPPSFDGVSLLSVIRGEPAEPRTVFFENPFRGEFGVRTEGWTYLEGYAGGSKLRRWLYRADDAGQRENLADQEPELVARFGALVQEHRETSRRRALTGAEVELDEQRIRQLEALGYLQ